MPDPVESYPTPPGTGHGERTPPVAGVRAEILASWQRSQSLGIDPEGAALPIESDLDPDSRLMRAASPVLEHLFERFSGVPVTLALADSRANIVDRWGDPAGLRLMDAASLLPGANVDERFMGTSSVSMVLSTRAPFVVVGHEHFLHDLKELTCMAAPVRDPVGGTVRGAVNLSVPRVLADPGMALVLQDATERIGERLLELSRARELELMRSFRWAGERGGRGELDLGSGELSRLSGPAPRLASQERLILLERAVELISSTGETYAEVPLAGSRVAMLRRRELHHGDAEGAAVEVSFEDTRGTGTSGTVTTATAPDGRHVPLLDPSTVAESANAPRAAAEPQAGGPTDAWLLLVGERGVGRLATEARGRLSLLSEAGIRLGTTLDMGRTAEEVAEIAVPRFADLVVVDLLESVLSGEGPPPGRLSPDVALRRVAAWAGEDSRDTPLGGVGEPAGYPAGTPQSRCLETGQPVTDTVLTATLTGPPEGRGHPVDLLGEGVHSYLAAPLCARGSVLGLAGFYRRGRTRPYEQDDLTLAGELAARAAISVDNARHYRREHHASLTLQRSLLPHVLPRLSAVELASRYLPADATAGVGGDWFDAIPLSGMRAALVVGDVPGNGLQAAATMGRLRTAVRTLAGMDLLPEEVLAHLDDLVSRTPAESADDEDPATGATCLYAVYDPVSCRCTAARAGHPPPALLTPDGEARLIDMPAGPPLGLGGIHPYESTTVELPADSLLAMYTDGLLKESRGYGDTDARTGQLLASLNDAGPALEDVCDRVSDTLVAGGPRDDVALLLARVHALPDDRVASWEFPSDFAVVARARELTRAQLAAWGMSELDFNTGLVVSELVTNAVRYGGRGPVGLRLLRDDSLICEVSDRSNTSPRIRRAATTEEGGRGLFLVAQFTKSWGARYMPQGKTVWAEQIPQPEQPASETDEQALLAMFDEHG
ncbi:SpoIIE family protein phosphatase [Streptomyces lancefieldiae]|uniref:SpoIIE family protein phosphatase n=1 Tax=Streptomyces lancefieldiae TaxID=3075520 RepID=A0ABU3AG26_9ACTN|nr:SpoIIE family protein phosphatase [Streptomyces sp. DSM 40712]MDT0609124.1 SpoIIE family protein phosphatase [Streptomyces sp. DSM 40712]